MKKIVLSILVLCTLMHTVSAAEEELQEAFASWYGDMPILTESDSIAGFTDLSDSHEAVKNDLFIELLDILKNTKTCINADKKSKKEQITSLSQQWATIAALLSYSREDFIRLLINGFETNLARVRPEDKLPAYTPFHVLYNAATPNDLKSITIKKISANLIAAYDTYRETKVDNELLRQTLATVNRAFEKAGINPLKTDDGYGQLISLIRQSGYDFNAPFGITQYQAYHEDYANHDTTYYTCLTTFQNDFKNICSRLGITESDALLYARALKFVLSPREDDERLVPQAKEIINKMVINYEDFLPKSKVERMAGAVTGAVTSAVTGAVDYSKNKVEEATDAVTGGAKDVLNFVKQLYWRATMVRN